MIAPSTVYLPIESGITQLKILAKSLLRQGFRRQAYLSMSQGPAPLTAGSMVRQFYIDIDAYLPRLKLADSARDKVLFGALYITARLEDIPLKGDYGPAESKAADPCPRTRGSPPSANSAFPAASSSAPGRPA